MFVQRFFCTTSTIERTKKWILFFLFIMKNNNCTTLFLHLYVCQGGSSHMLGVFCEVQIYHAQTPMWPVWASLILKESPLSIFYLVCHVKICCSAERRGEPFGPSVCLRACPLHCMKLHFMCQRLFLTNCCTGLFFVRGSSILDFCHMIGGVSSCDFCLYLWGEASEVFFFLHDGQQMWRSWLFATSSLLLLQDWPIGSTIFTPHEAFLSAISNVNN